MKTKFNVLLVLVGVVTCLALARWTSTGIQGSAKSATIISTQENDQVAMRLETKSELDIDQFQDPVDGSPIFVHILGYQRTGSSFLGTILDRTPNIFYIYEPLGMVYTAMFGSKPHGNRPNAIFTSGSNNRNLIDEEDKLVRWMLETLFHCNFSSFPPSILLHPFWLFFEQNMTHVAPYNKCLLDHKISAYGDYSRCQKHIQDICPEELGNPLNEKSLMCFKQLVKNGMLASIDDKDSLPMSFQMYLKCMDSHSDVLRACAKDHLDRVCVNKNVRAVKTVRGVMDTGNYFLKKYPNYRLVHLFRDPRAVVSSRLKVHWAQTDFDRGNVYRIAGAYCDLVMRHYLEAQKSRKIFPGQVQQILHDHFFENPKINLEHLMLFSGINEIPKTTLDYFNGKFNESSSLRMTDDGELETTVLNHWIDSMSCSDSLKIKFACEKFFEKVPYEFIKT